MFPDLLLFVVIGFVAQIIDGAIGMAYGLISTTVLLSLGVTPSVASASVHAAEVFTTGASAISHWHFANLDKRLFWKLAPAGIFGGALGAYVLTAFSGEVIRPFVTAYLAVMGGVVIWKALRKGLPQQKQPRGVPLLGLLGGFLDAIGGGGWGALVASTLVGQGTSARIAIGTTNAAEFLVTLAISATFVVTVGLQLWPIILGLILGGIVAAPFAAYLARIVPDRPLRIIVGIVIILLSAREVLRLHGTI